MIATVGICERLNTIPPSDTATPAGQDPFNAPQTVFSKLAASETNVLIDRTGDARQFVARYIQNTSANTIYYAVCATASAALYHGQIAAGQQMAVFSMGPVSVYGPSAWTVTTLELYRTQG